MYMQGFYCCRPAASCGVLWPVHWADTLYTVWPNIHVLSVWWCIHVYDSVHLHVCVV